MTLANCELKMYDTGKTLKLIQTPASGRVSSNLQEQARGLLVVLWPSLLSLSLVREREQTGRLKHSKRRKETKPQLWLLPTPQQSRPLLLACHLADQTPDWGRPFQIARNTPCL